MPFHDWYNLTRDRYNDKINGGIYDPDNYWCAKAQSVFNQQVFAGMEDAAQPEWESTDYENWINQQKSCFEECSLPYNLDNGVQVRSQNTT